MFELERIDHVAITVSDLENSIKWYRDVLGLERYYGDAWDGVPIMMEKGGTCVALFKVRRNNPDRDKSDPPAERADKLRLVLPEKRWNMLTMQHLAFRADRRNFENAQESLKERGIEFRFVDHEISHSIYFRDPDGHEIEITTHEVN